MRSRNRFRPVVLFGFGPARSYARLVDPVPDLLTNERSDALEAALGGEFGTFLRHWVWILIFCIGVVFGYILAIAATVLTSALALLAMPFVLVLAAFDRLVSTGPART